MRGGGERGKEGKMRRGGGGEEGRVARVRVGRERVRGWKGVEGSRTTHT